MHLFPDYQQNQFLGVELSNLKVCVLLKGNAYLPSKESEAYTPASNVQD